MSEQYQSIPGTDLQLAITIKPTPLLGVYGTMFRKLFAGDVPSAYLHLQWRMGETAPVQRCVLAISAQTEQGKAAGEVRIPYADGKLRACVVAIHAICEGNKVHVVFKHGEHSHRFSFEQQALVTPKQWPWPPVETDEVPATLPEAQAA